MPTNETNKTAQEQTLSNNQIAVTETEKQFVEDLKIICSDSIEINEKIREYEKEQESISQKYIDKIITLEECKIEINLINYKIDELFETIKKEISKNKQKLIKLYNEMQTTSKNAFDIYKLYDAKKIDKHIFEYLCDALDRKRKNIEYVLDKYKDSFIPLYAAKMMVEYGITDKGFIFRSKDLFKYEHFANNLLFIYMYLKMSLSDYMFKVVEYKIKIMNLLAGYTDEKYKAIVF